MQVCPFNFFVKLNYFRLALFSNEFDQDSLKITNLNLQNKLYTTEEMSAVSEIQTKIEALPHNEYIKLIDWFTERDWKIWDKQIEKDTLNGSLNFLIDEALNEKTALKLKDL